MRRSRRKTTKHAQETSLKSSSEDSDHQNTMNIIERMSKKLMEKKTMPRNVCSPETSRKISTKKSSTPIPRVTRSRSKSGWRDSAYEGDVDSSTGTTGSSDGTTDLYDFDQSNEENLCLVLFPTSRLSSVKKNKVKQNVPVIDSKGTSPKTVSEKKRPQQKAPVLKTSNTNNKHDKLAGDQKAKPKQKSGIKRKEASLGQIAPVAKKSTTQRTGTQLVETSSAQKAKGRSTETSMFDSGVFMSPIERVADNSLNTPNLTPIPTPSLSLSDLSADQHLPLQFDSLLEEPPTLSPVKSPAKRPKIEPMDLGSPQLKTPSAEKTYSHRGLFLSPSERLEKKKARSKPRVTSKRIDAWASQMNAEFEEIEMYDLSIEDQ